ncbi:MAG: FAD-dependent oxidoreductase [Deltaproteobacteria bacterium]|nr:MAG: FAD-dependent oxidoreductase [Deltaproteobacteria bacterium]
MKPTVAVVGAGILGRLISFFLIEDGHSVSLFEKNGQLPSAKDSCSLTAAGMLAPFCELEYSDPLITQMGLESIAIWEKIHKYFDYGFHFERKGSLVITHPRDQAELLKLKEIIKKNFKKPVYREEEVTKFEPFIKGFGKGLYFPFEGLVDPESFFKIYNEKYLNKFENLYFNTKVEKIGPGRVDQHLFDLVIDCRGFAAKGDLKDFRGVRGELLLIEAPEVKLNSFVRLMHPRYPLYVVPKPNGRFIVGATSLECEDLSPISVRSSLELLSAIYSIHPAFGEGRIIESRVHLRPGFIDNLPKIEAEEGLIRANGLYRHGYLVSPKLAQQVFNLVKENRSSHATFN